MRFIFKVNPESFSRFVRAALAVTDPSSPGPAQDALLDASDAYHDRQRERFDNEGEGDWPPLAPATVRARQRAGYGPDHPILQETTELRQSLNRGGANHVLDVTAETILEGTADPKAARLHYGDASRNLPSRTIYVPPDQDTLERMKTAEAVQLSVAIKNAAQESRG